jgi:norsolorinic acid ketoreductase
VVDTDMGKAGVASMGITIQQVGGVSPAQSVSGILSVIDAATKESHGGKFWDYTGNQLTY